jgi:hypothetical protein
MHTPLTDPLAVRREMLEAAHRLCEHANWPIARAQDHVAHADAVLRRIRPLLRPGAETDAAD